MKNKTYITILIVMIFTGCKIKKVEKERMCTRVDVEKVLSLFPKNVDEINLLNSQAQQVMNDMIQNLDITQVKNQTFSNTVRAYDIAKLKFLINRNLLSIYSLLSSNPKIQNAAKAQVLSLNNYESETLLRNTTLYKTFQKYLDDGCDVYRKKGANRQFLEKTLQKFERQGLLLTDLQREEIINLDKTIKKLESKFSDNIVYDNKNIVACSNDLLGIAQSFIDTLKKDSNDNYILPLDLVTFYMIMENCESEALRKQYYFAFGKLGYPQNKLVLPELLYARNQFAQKLNYIDFATYELDEQMIKDPKKAEKFLLDIIHELQKYDDQDFISLKENLPSSVKLLKDNILNPWDEEFVKSYYKKNHFIINDSEISKYFTLEHTLDQLLHIFSQLFFIEFKKEKISPEQLWAPDVICYRVYSLQSQSVLGYLFLDLYKHNYKQVNEPSHFMLLPTIKDDCSISCAGASVMVSNFTKSTNDTATLLNLSDVTSLFHELGHALHDLFGATCFVDFSGTQVIKDFVEVPSQMLEYLLEDPNIIQLISKHYQTGQKLPQQVIEQIIYSQHFCQASKMLKHAFLGLISLKIHNVKENKEIHNIIEKIYKKVFKHISYEKQNYLEYGFTAISNYKSSYYTYIWSKVIAADLFNHIKTNGGILNCEIGKEYVKNILIPGGFISPQYMLKNFLKRPFSIEAFLYQLNKKEILFNKNE